MGPNNSFKPNLLRSTNNMAGKSCHVVGSTTQVGLTQALSDAGDVIGCVEIKAVQWYQCEVLHLTVAEEHTRKGVARTLLAKATKAASDKNARILQCTIREGNEESEGLFSVAGFSRVSSFFNRASGNSVGVWQKVLSPPT